MGREMKSKDYMKWALTKDRTDEGYQAFNQSTFTSSKGRLINGALGLAGECGEVVDLIKKHTQYNKELDKYKLREELGDILWYMAIILADIGSSFEEVMKQNQVKLNLRFPSSFSEEQAIARADKLQDTD